MIITPSRSVSEYDAQRDFYQKMMVPEPICEEDFDFNSHKITGQMRGNRFSKSDLPDWGNFEKIIHFGSSKCPIKGNRIHRVVGVKNGKQTFLTAEKL